MQKEKQLYLDFYSALLGASNDGIPAVARCFLSEDCQWHGPHPVNRAAGPHEIATKAWMPMKNAFTNLERQAHILIQDEYEGRTWVAATGYYTGLFSGNWLGIPANDQLMPLRFGEFARIANGKIREFRILFDLVAFCGLAGMPLLPPSRGAEVQVPAPATRDGVMTDEQDPAERTRSLGLVEAMIGGLLQYDGENLHSMGMDRFWREDMRWYGPGGIGTTYGLDGFQAHHQGPFLEAFPDRTTGPHSALLAEGSYVCVTGWPSVIATHNGCYLGTPPTKRRVGMRVMDFWRRNDDLLAENWVMIDMLDLFLQLGVDLLKTGVSEAVG